MAYRHQPLHRPLWLVEVEGEGTSPRSGRPGDGPEPQVVALHGVGKLLGSVYAIYLSLRPKIFCVCLCV